MHVLLNKLTYCYFDVLVEVAIVVAKTLYEWNALNAIWSHAFGPSVTRNLITHCFGAKRFYLRSLSPALRNPRLLLVSTNFMFLVFLLLLFLNSACQQGWIGKGKSCYKLFTSSKTWENAKKECEKWHAGLVKVESREENDFIKTKLLPTDKEENYWIGLSDSDNENDWKWTDGTRLDLDGYKNWRGNEPDNHNGNEDCVVIVRISTDPYHYGKWSDISCSLERKYICENP